MRMQPHGRDRVRIAGTRTILYSPISKGWTARVPKKGTHAEHPGTAVMWEGVCFEVIAVEQGEGEIRYVMSPWDDQQVIRRMVPYDEESEVSRLATHAKIQLQRKQSVAASFASMFLGHLPAREQGRLENELGISSTGMTLASCIPPVAFSGAVIFLAVGARMENRGSPLWLPLLILSAYLLTETTLRFYVAMSQTRGVGSAAGYLLFGVYWLTVLKADPARSPFGGGRGLGIRTLPPTEEVALKDAMDTWGPFLSLLTVGEQRMLEQRYGFDHRRHAFGLTWGILTACSIGALSSFVKLLNDVSVSAALSFIAAGLLAFEQILRLRELPRQPAGSVLAPLVRPFVRRLLTIAR